jgi:general secretion pathway protein G
MVSRACRGFSVIELLVALALLGLLAGVSMPLVDAVRQRERERDLRLALWTIRDALDAYKTASDRMSGGHPDRTESGYPASLAHLVTGLPDANAPGGVRRFLRQIPRDPFADPQLPAEQTWLVRAYASEADRPMPGADVYDVRSRATGLALNGQALSQW